MQRGVRFPEAALAELAARFGGEVQLSESEQASSARRNRRENKLIGRIVPIEVAQSGDLAPLIHPRFVSHATAAIARGASLLVDASLVSKIEIDASDRDRLWVSASASRVMADLLDACDVENVAPVVDKSATLGQHVVIHPRVVIGKNVRIGSHSVIGHPGFGWVISDRSDGKSGAHAIPQLGGVVIEDDVSIGPLCTIDAGTLSPTRIRRGTKIDAHVHVGHNGDIGEGCMIAAQVGFAGSVTIGRGVWIGGQAGFGDHVTVGDGARIGGKSGVIGDIPAGAVVAGYPAVPRLRWLRGVAEIGRRVRGAK